MLTLFTWTSDGPFLRFSFSPSPFYDDDGWEHAVLEIPIASCYDETLLPLVSASGEQLAIDEVIRSVVERATGARTWPSAVDWLGLALYAQFRFRLATGKLLTGDPRKHQTECRATDLLATTLEKVYERFARAVAVAMPGGSLLSLLPAETNGVRPSEAPLPAGATPTGST